MLVVEAHILTAAMQIFEMSSIDDTPSEELFPASSLQEDSLRQCTILMDALSEFTRHFVDLDVAFKEGHADKDPRQIDHVEEYAHEVMSLGLLLMEFSDAIHEGDGSCIFRCWRYFLPLFKASERTNYSVEAFSLLVHEKYLLSP